MEKFNIKKYENDLQKLLDKHKTYDLFSLNNHAYDYAEIINKDATYCLYCNIASIEVIRHKNNKYKGQRPTYDHFKPKSKFKKCAKDCHNLIPCCHECNSDYKGSKNYKYFLNPFEYDFNQLAKFDFDVDIDTLKNKDNYYNKKIKIEVTTNNQKLRQKTTTHIYYLNLEKRYNSDNVKKELKSFFTDIICTTDIKIKDYKDLNFAEQEIRDRIFDIKNQPINKTKYGKLKHDMFKKYCMI